MVDQTQQEMMPPAYEPIEANVRAVWITGAALASTVAAAFLLTFGIQSWLVAKHSSPETQAAPVQSSVTDPDWNVPPQVQQLRMKEEQFLTTYAWVETASVARIPLDRALAVVAEDGLPVAIGADVQPASQNSDE